MKAQYLIKLRTWMATMLAILCCQLAGAQAGQVTLSFANAKLVSPTEAQFDVEMSNTGPSELKLNGANIHANPNSNVSNALENPVYELVEVGQHFAEMKSHPVLAYSPVNGVNLRCTQSPHGDVGSAPAIPTKPTLFFRGRLTTSAPMGNLELLFHDGKLPSISVSVYINGEPTARTINVEGTQHGNVVLGAHASFALSSVEIKDLEGSNEFGVVNVFPLPTSGKVTLQVNLPESTNLAVSVTDANGRLMQAFEQVLGKGLSDVQVDLTRLAASTYFVKLDNGTTQLTEQVVKQ